MQLPVNIRKTQLPKSPFGDSLSDMTACDLADSNTMRFREYFLDQKLKRANLGLIVDARIRTILGD